MSNCPRSDLVFAVHAGCLQTRRPTGNRTLKKLLAFIVVCSFPSPLSAEDVLFMGKRYRNATLEALAPGGKVVLGSKDGKVTVAWANLSRPFKQENQMVYEQLHKAARADGSIDELYKDRAVRVKSLLADFRGANANKLIAERLKTILEVQTDPRTFRGQILCFQGLLETKSYYNYGYEDARDSHLVFYMRSGTADAYLYMPRSFATDLTERILSCGPINVTCLVEIPMESEGTERRHILAELLDVRPLPVNSDKK